MAGSRWGGTGSTSPVCSANGASPSTKTEQLGNGDEGKHKGEGHTLALWWESPSSQPWRDITATCLALQSRHPSSYVKSKHDFSPPPAMSCVPFPITGSFLLLGMWGWRDLGAPTGWMGGRMMKNLVLFLASKCSFLGDWGWGRQHISFAKQFSPST